MAVAHHYLNFQIATVGFVWAVLHGYLHLRHSFHEIPKSRSSRLLPLVPHTPAETNYMV